jgi:hypothetical protein
MTGPGSSCSTGEWAAWATSEPRLKPEIGSLFLEESGQWEAAWVLPCASKSVAFGHGLGHL